MMTRHFECGLVEIRYDCDHPDHGEQEPSLELPPGFRWHQFPYPPWAVRAFYALWEKLPFGWGRSWGWQAVWSDSIVIQPGETIMMGLVFSVRAGPSPDAPASPQEHDRR